MNDPLQRASVTLQFFGDDLVPDELTRLLGREPEIAAPKGAPLSRPGGVSAARTGTWVLGFGDREPPCIDEQIREMIENLPGDLRIWNDLSHRFKCYVAVGVWFADGSWTGGIVLEPQTLSMLGERGLAIDFDMYAPGASN